MIEEYKIGRFVVEGEEFLGDLKMKLGKPHYWQTRERRKLRIEDIKDLVEEQPDVFIIGTGAGGMLQVGEEITNYIYNNSGKVFVIQEKNTEAIESYNKAEKQKKKVCAIFPSGC